MRKATGFVTSDNKFFLREIDAAKHQLALQLGDLLNEIEAPGSLNGTAKHYIIAFMVENNGKFARIFDEYAHNLQES